VEYYAVFFAEEGDENNSTRAHNRGLEYRIAVVTTFDLAGREFFEYKYKGPVPEKATHIAVYSGNGRVGPLRMYEPLRLQTTGITQPFYDSMQPPLDSPLAVRSLDVDTDTRCLPPSPTLSPYSSAMA
jgi:hypothetical protein